MNVRITYCCSRCGSDEFRPAISRRLADGLLACLSVRPQRCYMCRSRFYLFQPAGLRALLRALDQPSLGAVPGKPVGSEDAPRAMAVGAGVVRR